MPPSSPKSDIVVRLKRNGNRTVFEIQRSLFIATSPLPSIPEADMIDASACRPVLPVDLREIAPQVNFFHWLS